MKKIILISLIMAAMAATTGDADAAKRKRHVKRVDVVTVDMPRARSTTSVFDGESWQPPILLPGLVSSYQAYAASQYTWEGEAHLFPKVSYAYGQDLKMPQKPVINAISPIEKACIIVIVMCAFGLMGCAVWPIRNSRP